MLSEQNSSTHFDPSTDLGRVMEISMLLASVLTDEEKAMLKMFFGEGSKSSRTDPFKSETLEIGNTSVT